MIGSGIQFASAATEQSSDLLGSLGIDVQLLVLQTIAFLLLLVILSKWVFPVLSRMLEKREKLIEESVRAAAEAEANAVKAEAKIADMMKQARKEADELLSSAKSEAAQMVSDADKKSRDRAEQIVEAAEAEIQKNVEAARSSLRRETLELVAEATEKVVGSTVDARVDQKIVERALKEAQA